MITHITAQNFNDEAGMEKAQQLRKEAIAQGRGCLIVQADFDEHPPQHQLEKILCGHPLMPGGANEQLWKPDPLIIVVGPSLAPLDALEEVCPGLKAAFVSWPE